MISRNTSEVWFGARPSWQTLKDFCVVVKIIALFRAFISSHSKVPYILNILLLGSGCRLEIERRGKKSSINRNGFNMG